MTLQPLTIVLVEDDEGHAELIRLNLQRAHLSNDIVHLLDGQAALDYLRREGMYASRERQLLVVLLDINMPRLDGIETLRQLKGNARTAKIPVIMVTTTDDPREMERCYGLGCNFYVTKPMEYDQFCNALRELGVFFQYIRVPHEAS
jgi:CheY-like chemotaxis protein